MVVISYSTTTVLPPCVCLSVVRCTYCRSTLCCSDRVLVVPRCTSLGVRCHVWCTKPSCACRVHLAINHLLDHSIIHRGSFVLLSLLSRTIYTAVVIRSALISFCLKKCLIPPEGHVVFFQLRNIMNSCCCCCWYHAVIFVLLLLYCSLIECVCVIQWNVRCLC